MDAVKAVVDCFAGQPKSQGFKCAIDPGRAAAGKARLLSFEEPVRFLFSHSARREGWDNPNVFVICTLKHSDNTVSRRQEVGRGMRLAVTQSGDRMNEARWAVRAASICKSRRWRDGEKAITLPNPATFETNRRPSGSCRKMGRRGRPGGGPDPAKRLPCCLLSREFGRLPYRVPGTRNTVTAVFRSPLVRDMLIIQAAFRLCSGKSRNTSPMGADHDRTRLNSATANHIRTRYLSCRRELGEQERVRQ